MGMSSWKLRITPYIAGFRTPFVIGNKIPPMYGKLQVLLVTPARSLQLVVTRCVVPYIEGCRVGSLIQTNYLKRYFCY